MNFQERLKKRRIAAGLTQVELANKVGVSTRTIQNYESGFRKVNNIEIARKLAEVLGTDVDELLDIGEKLEAEAYAKGGRRSAMDINELVEEVTGLFAGGKLSEDAMDGAMKALNEAYWIAKENNKKYAPKSKRKKKD